MQKRTAWYISLIILVAWCAFIFYMSAKVAVDSDAMSLGVVDRLLIFIAPNFDQMSAAEQTAYLSLMNHIVRKLAHFSEYALLGMLSFNVAWQIKKTFATGENAVLRFLQKGSFWPAAVCGWIFATLYAATDEFHQIFVAGRSCQFTDVCIDSTGALTGILFVLLIAVMAQRIKKKGEPA